MSKQKIQLKANPNCKTCHGSGFYYEHHPYGSTTATETLECECATEFLSEEEYAKVSSDIDDGNYEVVPSDEWNNQMSAFAKQENEFDNQQDNHDTPLGEQYDSMGELEDN